MIIYKGHMKYFIFLITTNTFSGNYQIKSINMDCEQIERPLVSSISTQLSNDFHMDIKHEVSKSSGLPNIMNTCFLNSILQQLYQIAIINYFLSGKDSVIDVDQEEDLLACLKVLFKMMGDDAPANKKRLILVKIRDHMTKMLLDYEAGSQYDSFETFTCIFDYLAQRIPRLYQYFEMEYNQSCGCPYEAMNFVATNIQGHKIMCLQCKSQIKRQFITLPRYLVVNYEKGNNQVELPSRLQNDEWYYTLESRNIYNGSGRFGHYYSECLYDGKFYTFDDNSNVRLSQKDNRGKCLFAIYKKNMKENDANSSKIQKVPTENASKARFIRKKMGKGKQQLKGRGSNKTKVQRLNKPKPCDSRQMSIIPTNSVKIDQNIYLNKDYITRATKSSCYLYIRSILPAQLKGYLEKIYQFIRYKILSGISHLVLRTRPIRKGKEGVKKKIEIIEMS